MKVKEITLEKAVVQHRITFTKEDIEEGLELLIGAGLLILGSGISMLLLSLISLG